MAVRLSLSARRAALACGVAALALLPPDADVPRRTELRRFRGPVRSRGVWTGRRDVGVSAVDTWPLGVRAGVLCVEPLRSMLLWLEGVDSMVDGGGGRAEDALDRGGIAPMLLGQVNSE